MYIHNINPILLDLGFFQIKYYSLAYILGAIISYFMIKYLARHKGLRLGKKNLLDLILYTLIGIIIGARLGYVLFYNISYYFSKPLEIFAVWQGGMSFHGGLLGACIAAYILCRKRKLDFWKIADITVIPVTLALMLGRIGNFINGELYGRITNAPWAVKFKGAEGFRHPSQIYEAFKNFVMFSILWPFKEKDVPKGFIFWLFILLYGLFRFMIEFAREPDAHIGLFMGFTRGQYFCAVMVLLGAYMLAHLKYKK